MASESEWQCACKEGLGDSRVPTLCREGCIASWVYVYFTGTAINVETQLFALVLPSFISPLQIATMSVIHTIIIIIIMTKYSCGLFLCVVIYVPV